MNALSEPSVRRARNRRPGLPSSSSRASGLRSSTTSPFSVGGKASTQRRATSSSLQRQQASGS